MTASPDNFLPPLPPGLDEVDLLAWVEGDPLPRNREVAIARLLSDHPPLARRLEAMRRDRDDLRAISGDQRAPAGLLDGVKAALEPVLERQMLLDIQDGQVSDERPPVSLVMPSRRSVIDVLFRERAGRRMALAAGLLLMVGGTTWFAATMFSGNNQGSEPDRLASNDGASPDTEPDSGTFALGPASPDEGTADSPDDASAATLAQGDETHDDASPAAAGTLAQGPDPALPDDGAAPAAASTLALTDPGETEPETPAMTLAEAIRLAEESRLVIRVRLGDGLVRSDRVVDRLRRNSSGWRYSGEAPQTLAAALIRPVQHREPVLIRPGHVVASSQMGDLPIGALMGPPDPRELLQLPEPRTGVFLVQSRLDEASIESLRTALAGVTAEVWFEEADEGVEAPIEMLPNLAPSAVLWWGQPPTAWTWWTSIPVVVEPGR